MLFENIKKIEKSLASLILKNIHITKIRNERGDINTQPTDIKRLIEKYYEQLHANKTDNSDEVDTFMKELYSSLLLLLNYCKHNLKQMYYLTVLKSEVQNGFHLAKIKVYSFWRLWRRVCFPPFSSFCRLHAFPGFCFPDGNCFTLTSVPVVTSF